ncbi:HCNGP-like protein-domain-containing protein [Lineolata rhizophorae]|uniref:HCNGP-like protein-domain-containing protein n=1 Tax=Lineolata rhizophorae TaxID=578093 RepID=A0A6A6NYU4_9PEZI|nr:HCNGP-like protein-domain-containing protein [Lineolata rhizophorae]
MLGLSGYSSSEEEGSPPPQPTKQANAPPRVAEAADDKKEIAATSKPSEPSQPATTSHPSNGTAEGQNDTESMSKAQPPSATLAPPTSEPAASASPGAAATPASARDSSQSPYTAARDLTHQLTMPPVPNFAIPDSPPGSPPADATAKFDRFLALKRTGVHFNSKLANSAALRNPGLLTKLREFAGIGDDGGEEGNQYAQALPQGLGVRVEWPEWAFADRLEAAQAGVRKKREGEARAKGREGVEFVAAGQDVPGGSGKKSKGARESVPERLRKGVDEGRQKSLPKEAERRGGESGRKRARSRSRSPRRY